MKILDHTFRTPEENLACDEALLDWAEEGAGAPVLRFWESPGLFAVLGYSKKIASEVDLKACRKDGVPVLRRCSGGGTVLQGPGCLNYSLILKIEGGELGTLRGTNGFVLKQHERAFKALGIDARMEGHTDLTVTGLKFSGNAQRRKRRFLLFHGTFLYRFDLALISKYLPVPADQPAYRNNRGHAAFVVNVRSDAADIKRSVAKVWDAREAFGKTPLEKIETLSKEVYTRREWTERF